MIALRQAVGFSIADIRMFAEQFEKQEFGDVSFISTKIKDYIETHDRLAAEHHKPHKFNEMMAAVIADSDIDGHRPRKPLSSLYTA